MHKRKKIIKSNLFKNIEHLYTINMNKENVFLEENVKKIYKKKNIIRNKITNVSKKSISILPHESIIQNLSYKHRIKNISHIKKIPKYTIDDESFIKNTNTQYNIKHDHLHSDNNINYSKEKKNHTFHNHVDQSNKKNITCENSNYKSITIIKKNIIINDTIKISELASKMAIKGSEMIRRCLNMGHAVTIDQIIDQETAQLIVEEMGYNAVLHDDNFLEKSIIHEFHQENKKYKKVLRPPVVTIMGHVDHGKTSLLDYIRSTNIVDKEAGNITQHIGAYHVKTKYGIITFLDTPGHAAFTAMRARGAQITDIVILVVAGDDGVKPQTIEAIQHAKAANVPLLVAINKIDKPESNIEKVKKELLQHQILSEEWGGETIFVNVSSVTGEGIDNLLRAILLQAEILELFAANCGISHGVVIEASLDKNRGPLATILIQEGRLNKGDNILCGCTYGKVRFMRDSFNNILKYATPSIPIEILGLSDIPNSGDIFYVVKNEQKVRQIVLHRKNIFRNNTLKQKKKINLDNIFDNIVNKKNNELNIILKCDVQGSLEAISNAIVPLSEKNITVTIISSYVGEITETDVSLAMASHAMIIGFNVRPNILAKRLIKIENVDVRYYSVIYQLIDDIKLAVSGMHSPICRSSIEGSAEIRTVFKPTKSIVIAGCMVISGSMKRNDTVHIIRNNTVIHKGELESLRRFKEDIKEVGIGKECGIKIKNYNDIRVGDIIEAYAMLPIKNNF
ncbi:Translation initiation factor IF-2 [isoform beta'] [Buchnera aphidicola (Myzocallis carpini)]